MSNLPVATLTRDPCVIGDSGVHRKDDPMREECKPNVASLAKELILYRQRAYHAQSEMNVAICVACKLLVELSESLRRADVFAQRRTG